MMAWPEHTRISLRGCPYGRLGEARLLALTWGHG